MAILKKVTGTVKDVLVLGKSIAKVVKEEVVGFTNDHDDYDYNEESEDDSKSVFTYLETFESKAKEVIGTAFSGFKTSKKDQAELEERIVALEAKLSKLVEESLEAIRK